MEMLEDECVKRKKMDPAYARFMQKSEMCFAGAFGSDRTFRTQLAIEWQAMKCKVCDQDDCPYKKQ